MTKTNRIAGALATSALVGLSLVWASAPGRAAEGDIAGTVTSSQGPEAGVWVIAETTDLPTKFIKSVVTTDGGRFLIPELPEASYKVWVRGYGLLDSAGVTASPGDSVELEVTVATDPVAAARVYPANYWYSLIQPPMANEFPGTGADGNGIASTLEHQEQWVDIQKQGCMLCHQLGNRIIREIDNIDQFDSTMAAWDHRVQMGQRGSQMTNAMNRFGRQRGLQMFADWSERIASGAVPSVPPRPQGIERNVVVSMWEWGSEIDYVHDEIATDKRNPRVNANGPIYGVNISNDYLTMLDPTTHLATNLKVPLRVDPATVPGMIAQSMPAPSRFFGDELLWNDPANPHNPMMDQKGRVWMTSAIRNRANPDYCREGSDNAFAQYFPLDNGFRSAVYYDPPTQKFVMVDTCFGTHHLQFAEDENDTLKTRTTRCISVVAGRWSAGSTPSSMTRPVTSARHRAGARRSSIQTGMALSRSRGTNRRGVGRSRRQIRRSIPASSWAATASSATPPTTVSSGSAPIDSPVPWPDSTLATIHPRRA